MLDHETKDMLNYVFKYNQQSFFIEAGAHDGVMQSNTIILEKKYNWNGLLIEPSPSLVFQCKNNRKALIEHTALVGPNYNQNNICGNFLSESAISSIDHPPSYFLENELLVNEFKERSNSYQTTVPANTLNKILHKHNISYVDFFSLDVEGYELEVLSGINFNDTHISLILIETANRPFYQKLVKEYLENKNFEFIKQISGNDDLFINKNII